MLVSRVVGVWSGNSAMSAELWGCTHGIASKGKRRFLPIFQLDLPFFLFLLLAKDAVEMSHKIFCMTERVWIIFVTLQIEH